MVGRILLAEDKDKYRQRVEKARVALTPDDLDRAGLLGVHLDPFELVRSARRRLREEHGASQPYDVLVLDLGLPVSDPKGRALARNGLELLKLVVNESLAKRIVVYTIFGEYEHVRDDYKKRVVDFVVKDEKREAKDVEALRRAIVTAFSSILEEESDELLSQRVRWLIPYARRAEVHLCELPLVDLAADVQHASSALAESLRDRYGVDVNRDPHIPIAKQVKSLTQATEQAQKKWQGIEAELYGESAKRENVPAAVILREIADELQPCLRAHRTTLTVKGGKDVKVKAYPDDLRVVLREIVAGAMVNAPMKDKHAITVSIRPEGRGVKIAFEDDFPAISDRDAERVNQLASNWPDWKYDRAWGLVECHQIIRRYSHRIDVTSGGDNGVSTGNRVVYSAL